MSDALNNIFAGSCAGIASTVVCHPMDTIRTRLQTSTQFTGALDCVKSTVRSEGYLALYKGMQAPVLFQGVYKAVIFGVNGAVGRVLSNGGERQLGLLDRIVCSVSGGGVNALVVTPVELVRNRLMIQYSHGVPGSGVKYSGPFDCAVQVAKTEGVPALWRGLSATVTRDAPGVAAWLLGFHYSKTFLSGVKPENVTHTVALTSGAVAGVSYWAVALPVDTVKSVVQTDVSGRFEGKSVLQVARRMLAEEGVSRFFRGWSVAFSRGIPGSAVVFWTHDRVLRYLSEEN